MDEYQSKNYMELYGTKRSEYEHFPREFKTGSFRETLRKVTGAGRILDYGCGFGSFGFLGTQDNITIDGLDFPINKLAKYNDLDQINHSYDTILFCHMVEHFGTDGPTQREQIKQAMTKIRDRQICNRIVIALPNNLNMFMCLRYHDDWTHNPVKPDNNDFLYFMECLGWKLKRIIRSDIQLNHDPRWWFRIFLNLASACDPTYNIIYVFEADRHV